MCEYVPKSYESEDNISLRLGTTLAAVSRRLNTDAKTKHATSSHDVSEVTCAVLSKLEVWQKKAFCSV
jgi:hypothetical protein